MQLAIPAAGNSACRATPSASHIQDACAAQGRADDPSHALSTIPRRGLDGQQLCGADEGAAAGRSEGHMPGISLNVISKRALQFSMLDDAIAGSDDATLGELAVQLHAPAPKLRMWVAN